MSEMLPLHYKTYLPKILIILGIIFTTIFIMGYLVADIIEAIYYSLGSTVIIIVGFGMQQNPYALYDEEQLILFNFRGKEREKYTYKSPQDINIKRDRLYLNGKKLKINKWFLNQAEWNRMMQFYSSFDNSLFSELKDD